MYLFINNISLNKVILGLGQAKKPFDFLNLPNFQNKNDRILSGIDRLLKKNKKNLSSLNGIIVINGPGSFAGIRIGLSVANTLAWVLNIPAIGVNLSQEKHSQELVKIGIKKLLKIKNLYRAKLSYTTESSYTTGSSDLRSDFRSSYRQKPVMPFYGKEPNITRAKQDY
ncbi:hypothetical protein KKG58_00660 [Patescibacteria group bacterium]|nr:hypothetical protein [Patescibacteria group bacterium]